MEPCEEARETCGGVCAATSQWLGVRGICFQAENTTAKDDWSYVGDGFGAYEKVSTYSYVGQGCGSFDKMEVEKKIYSWQPTKCCCCLCLLPCLLVLASGGIYLASAWKVLPSPVLHLIPDLLSTTAQPHSNQQDHANTPTQNPTSRKIHVSTTIQPSTGQSFANMSTPNASSDRFLNLTSSPYNCSVEYSSWNETWSQSKRTWCCNFDERGCPTTKTMTKRNKTTIYHCKVGLSNWEVGWSMKKKTWCCLHARLGCPKTVPVMVETLNNSTPKNMTSDIGCNTTCSYNGTSATCEARIRHSANHFFRGRPKSCESAHDLVVLRCPSCSACPFADTICTG